VTKRVGSIVPETLAHLLRKPATVLYPFERLEIPPGLRGRPVLDTEKCIGCGICARECPADAIEMVTLGKKLLRPGFYYDRCAFCGQCAESCPKDAITMTPEYELAALERETLYAAPERPSSAEEGEKGAKSNGGGGPEARDSDSEKEKDEN